MFKADHTPFIKLQESFGKYARKWTVQRTELSWVADFVFGCNGKRLLVEMKKSFLVFEAPQTLRYKIQRGEGNWNKGNRAFHPYKAYDLLLTIDRNGRSAWLLPYDDIPLDWKVTTLSESEKYLEWERKSDNTYFQEHNFTIDTLNARTVRKLEALLDQMDIASNPITSSVFATSSGQSEEADAAQEAVENEKKKPKLWVLDEAKDEGEDEGSEGGFIHREAQELVKWNDSAADYGRDIFYHTTKHPGGRFVFFDVRMVRK